MARLPRPDATGGAGERYGLLAHAPGIVHAFATVYGRLWRDGIVDEPTKEVMRLRNARLTGCGYCRNVRFDGARRAGLGEVDVARIDDGYAASALSARHKTAIALTDVVLGRAERVDAALATALAGAFSPPAVVELVVTAALCHAFSKIAVALGTAPTDMPVTVVPTPSPPE